MGMEVAGADTAAHRNGDIKTEEGVSTLHTMENGKAHLTNGASEAITFGSHGPDEPAKVEVENKPVSNYPKDAVEDWPAPKQIHSFYFVKYRSYEDPNVKAKLDTADKEFGKRNQQRFQMIESLKAQKTIKYQIIDQLKALGEERGKYYTIMEDKRKDMKPLQDALGNLRNPNGPRNVNGAGQRGADLCSSEEELDQRIQSLQYRIQHEVIPLTEEKQILRELKQLEATRPKVIAGATERAQIQEKFGQKEVIQDQVKLMGTDLDGVRKEQLTLKQKISKLKEELEVVNAQINRIQEELDGTSEKKDKAMEVIQKMRKQRDEGNACFYQNRSLLNSARELAAQKNVKALEELVSAEVEKFMNSWNSSKAFRNDYEKRISTSLDIRQLSRDGRMRNPDEKPLVLIESTRAVEQEAIKPSLKPAKEDSKASKDQESVPPQKKSKKETTEAKPASVARALEEEEIFVVEKPKKDVQKEEIIDEAKLKAMKREEEMAKQKQALERKKKLAEKNAAKAALKAQKEAEKKQKKKQKKDVKPSNQDEATANESEVVDEITAEDEKVEDTVPVEKTRETATVRPRTRGKAREALPKAILRRKKSNNYWMWAAPLAVLVALLVALIYKYAL